VRRFFLDVRVPEGQANVDLPGADAHHLRDVLRARPGDAVSVCDADGTELDCTVEAFEPDRVRLHVRARRPADTEPPYDAVVLQALVKGERMDWLVQKSVELGAARIVPFAAARSVVRLSPGEGPKKAERWGRIAEEAAKQCGRARIPPVLPPVPFAEALRLCAAADIAFLPWEGERRTDLAYLAHDPAARAALENARRAGRRPTLAFLVGPEGGFDAGEVAAAVAAGLRTITLGRRILRSETAAPAALAQLSLLLETGGADPGDRAPV
jgi:16S rRNA (uracil1498-N3)-methyltransferase